MIMLNKRQKEILRIIVEEYVRTAEPVGSKSICERINVSSATVRNEMVILEDLKLLEKNQQEEAESIKAHQSKLLEFVDDSEEDEEFEFREYVTKADINETQAAFDENK